MDNIEYTKLFEGNFIIVQRIKNALEDIGIYPVIKDESESGRLAGFSASMHGQQELFVSNNELDEAKKILTQVTS